MLLTLFDSLGNAKAEIQPDTSSTQVREIQGDSLLNLSFTSYEFISVDVNDYADYGGERYWAVQKYAPAQKSTVQWEYSFCLYGIESLIGRFLVLNDTDGRSEAVFTLTARPVDHIRLIVRNINAGMDGMGNFKAGIVEGNDNVTIDYSGKYCNEALKELAEAVGTEWWFDGSTLNLCRCEHGEEVALGYGRGLTGLDRDTADGAKFYTRLFPIGSTRNIDPEKYGHSRLMLPDGARYVDVNVEKYGIIHHYEQNAFAGIYPRRVGMVGSVRQSQVKDKDGKPFTIYYFKDNDLPFDPNDYEIGGLVKRVSFQEGSELAGLGADNDHYFEVNFNSDTKEFEIITIWPYGDGMQLPGGTLVPKPGDKYILWNIRMPDEYYGLAAQELRSAVDEYNRRHALDVSRYKAPTDHVWIQETGTELFIGRRIRLESREFFPATGCRQSRITKISRKVSLPGQMDLEISDALSTGAMTKIGDAIAGVRNYAGTLVGSINIPDVIRTGDTTRPADTNLYSARRTHREFLSKNDEDVAHGVITFLKGIIAKAVSYFKGIVNDGDIDNTGDIVNDGNIRNTGNVVTKNLTVTGKAAFFELEIIKAKASGGLDIKGPGEFHADLVEEVPAADGRLTGYRLYQNAEKDGRTLMQTVEAGDQMLSCRFNVGSGKYSDTGNHYYWRLVTEAPTEYVDKIIAGKMCRCLTITLSATDRDPSSNDAPQVGDDLVTCGSRTNSSRMGVQVTSVYRSFDGGLKTPYWAQYWGLNNYDWASHRRTFFANGDNSIIGNLRVTSPTGDTVRVPADKGAWTPSAAYGYYDRVSHAGALWLCTAPPGTLTHEEPGKGDAWQKQVEKGDMPVEMTISTDSGGTVIRNGQGNVTLRARLYRNGAEITSEYPETAFWWTRDSGNRDYDAAWNARHERAGSTVTVNAEDIFKKAVFHCEVRN